MEGLLMAVLTDGKKTVLVVEGDTIFREGLAVILQQEGYRVLLAGDGREALDRLHEGTLPNLILLDMMLPFEDGWRLLDHRRRQPGLASVPVVLLTSRGVTAAEWAAALGATAFVHKPVEVAALLDAVRGNIAAGQSQLRPSRPGTRRRQPDNGEKRRPRKGN
jgi:CheY-like chemotaxis protein